MASAYFSINKNTKGTVKCRLVDAGWSDTYKPTVIAIGRRGCTTNSNAQGYLYVVLKTEHKHLNRDPKDPAFKLVKIMVNMQRKVRRNHICIL